MKKNKIEKLIPIANEVLREQYEHSQNAILSTTGNNTFFIKKNYDGKVSGFGITVLLSGLLPALIMYFNESGDVKTRPILEAIAMIIRRDGIYQLLPQATADSLLQHALNQNVNLKELTNYILEASIALKQVVRTYELK